MKIGSLIAIILFSIIFPMTYSDKSRNSKNDGEVVFEFNDFTKGLMILNLLLWIILASIFLIIGIRQRDDNIMGAIIMTIFALMSSILCIAINNKKFVWKDNTLYVYNMWKKQTKIMPQEIVQAVEYASKGMELICKNGKKLKIDMQMTNYSKIKKILEENGIEYKDQYGNKETKGW